MLQIAYAGPGATFGIVGILVAPTVVASVCDEPGAESYASFEVVWYEREPVGLEEATTEKRDRNFHLLLDGPGRIRTGVKHWYTHFDFSGIELQTNAHLHILSFPVHWMDGDSTGSFRISIAPTISASSNVVQRPLKYRSDGLRPELALLRRTRISAELDVDYGVCSDHRFGRYRIYPSVGLGWQPHPRWRFDLGFPTAGIRYRATSSFATELRIAPEGGEWQVMDRDLDARSRFNYESWAAVWIFRVQTGERFGIEASVGRQMRNRFDVTLVDGERVSFDGEAANRAGLAIRWTF